jgi:heme A synthase
MVDSRYRVKNPWLHRFAILLAVLTVILIAIGATFTSETRTLPGTVDARPVVTAPALEQAHQVAGWLVGILTLGLAILLSLGKQSLELRLTGWTAFAIVIVESLYSIPVLHSLLAPVFLSIVVAIAVCTSSTWATGPEPVEKPWQPLHTLAILMVALVLVQVGLGAAFRHNAMGVISHIFNAMIVLLLILVVGVYVLRQYPEPRSLRSAALALLVIAGVQVLLGFGVYLVLLMTSENNIGLVISSVVHVVTGALTLSASVVLAIQIRRFVG